MRTANMDDLREVMARGIASIDPANPYKGTLDKTTLRDADAALAAIKEAGFVVVRESELRELEDRTAIMSRDFHYYGFRKGRDNATSAQTLIRAMIEASNAPT
jgi:hypothetical protein